MCGFLESGEEHSGEADGREVVDRSDNALIVAQGYLELIPLHFLIRAIAGWDHSDTFVGDVVPTHFQIFRTYRHTVLEVSFVLEGNTSYIH